MKKTKKQVRLSMKLLWKLYGEWSGKMIEHDQHAYAFLLFIEKELRSPKEI